MPAAPHVKKLTVPPALLGAGIAFAIAVAAFAGEGLTGVLLTLTLDAPIAILNLLAATLAGSAVVWRIFSSSPRTLAAASGAAVGIGVLTSIILMLGLAGWLNAATAWGTITLLGTVGAVDAYLARAWWTRPTEPVGLAGWLWIGPAVALGMATVAACMPAGTMWGGEPNAYDVLSYHLQLPREWYELGRIFPLEHNIFSHFPLATETLFLLAMHEAGGPWAGQYAAHFTNVGLAVLTTLAAYGSVRGIGGSPLAATVTATFVATLPWTILLSTIAYNEPLLILASVLAAGWLGRTLITGRALDAALAGLFAGLGVAAKYTGVPMLVVLGALAFLSGLWVSKARSGAPEARSASEVEPAEAGSVSSDATFRTSQGVVTLIAFLLAAGVLSSPWLIRNLAWFGNPVSPLASGLFGGVEGWAPEQYTRWQQAHSLPISRAPMQLLNEWLLSGNFGWLLWPTVLVGILIGLRRRPGVAVLAGLWLVGMLVVWATATHMAGRFLTVTLGPAVLAVGLVPWERVRPIGMAVAAVVAIVGLTYTALFAAGFGDTRGLVGMTGDERAQFLGITGPLEDPQRFAERDVYLVGDALAYAYPVEADQLHYRIVFNVPPADGAIRAWLGEALETAPDNAMVIVDLSDLDRLADTYGTPRLEVDLAPDPTSPDPYKPVLTMRRVRQLLGER